MLRHAAYVFLGRMRLVVLEVCKLGSPCNCTTGCCQALQAVTYQRLAASHPSLLKLQAISTKLASGVYPQGTAAEPGDSGVVAAEAPASNENQADVKLESQAEKGALDRQINPRGDPTPMQLPLEAQKAADEGPIEDSDDSPSSGTADQSTVEVPAPKDDKSPPSADEAALEGDDSPGGTADESAVEITAPKDDTSAPSPAPTEVAEGADAKESADAGTDTITASADGGASDVPTPSGVELNKDVEAEALKRQVAPKGEPTPVELPPEAKKAAQVRTALSTQHLHAVHIVLGMHNCTYLMLRRQVR